MFILNKDTYGIKDKYVLGVLKIMCGMDIVQHLKCANHDAHVLLLILRRSLCFGLAGMHIADISDLLVGNQSTGCGFQYSIRNFYRGVSRLKAYNIIFVRKIKYGKLYALNLPGICRYLIRTTPKVVEFVDAFDMPNDYITKRNVYTAALKYSTELFKNLGLPTNVDVLLGKSSQLESIVDIDEVAN